ncbi:Long-chain acyl-CoA synthetase (AMP-forming) [Amycolatopsis xylanica]|uniref:Long-chain acyl-CoA synthetase (AMP-forming) n=1 Tax=Amycolatopsis xylanica TaxID=589385 RepID=A0A1H3DS92_9PSEU|nr:AMP-dependent synthetase/ligase [Amycolatopsis xylanica]SDX69187.1 Long-chain acyl-CoA synthetase (AMP-forming) [Amycolatopsis xylanica]
MSRPSTFPEAFQLTVAAHPDAVALRTPGDTVQLTWKQYGDEVRRISSGLAALGLRRGDTFAAMLTNRPEFNLTEVAASHLGATTFSIYNTSSPEQIQYLLTHSDTKIMVCERQFADQIRASGATLEHLLVVEDGDLDRLEPAPDFDFEATWRAVTPDDLLCLIYTSGTTGPPKGVEHTHRGWLRMIDAMATIWPMEPGDTTISYLPSSHSGDRFFRHYYPIASGGQVTCLAELGKLAETIAELHPTTFAAVPRTWEKLKAGVERELLADPESAAAFEAGDPEFLASIRVKTGFDKLKWALTGTAAIPEHVYGFWEKLGAAVSVGWGMSECGFGSGSSPSESKIGTIGQLAPGAEAKLAEDGELLVRMPWMMRGYRKDPEKTAEALDPNGWLRTGDLATVDDEGNYRIIGRKKELIVNSGGKNMSPSNIEHAISAGSPLIGPMMAVGDNRPYNVALITLDPEAAAAFAAEAAIAVDAAVLAKDERVLAEITASVHAGNLKLSRIEQIKRFVVLPRFWAAGGDELTSNLKLKRAAISEKYATEIDALYAPNG